MAKADQLHSFRAFSLWLSLEFLAGGFLWLTGLISPALMIVLGIIGLAGVYCYDTHRRRLVLVCLLFAAMSVGAAIIFKKPPATPNNPPEIPLADLRYRVCGVPLQDHSYRVTHFVFGVELHNPNRVPVTAFIQDNHFLEFGGVTSALSGPHFKEIVVVPDERLGPGSQVAFIKSGVDFEPPKQPGRSMEGQVHWEMRFGKNRDAPDRRLIIAGALGLDFDRGGRMHTLLQFTPSGDSIGFDPVPCDLREPEFDTKGRRVGN